MIKRVYLLVDGKGKEFVWKKEGSGWEIGGNDSHVMQRPMAHAFFLHGSSAASMNPETGNIYRLPHKTYTLSVWNTGTTYLMKRCAEIKLQENVTKYLFFKH